MVPVTMLDGPGLPEEAFMFDVHNLYNQMPDKPEEQKMTTTMKKADLNRSIDTINFMQALAAKQDELLVSVIKIIGAIDVKHSIDEGGAPAWATVQEGVARDYENIVQFCQAGLSQILTDYPTEEDGDDKD